MNNNLTHISIGVAAGALIALLCFDLFPEIIESYSGAYLKGIIFTVLGVTILKVMDAIVPEHEAHDEDNNDSMTHVGIISTIAISLHNILEGMTIYHIISMDVTAGISLGVGICLHNIPIGMLIYSTLKHDIKPRKYALYALAIISTFIGMFIMRILSPILTEDLLSAFICITAGMVVYITAFELIPAIINSKNKITSVISALIGFVLVAGSAIFL